MTVVKNNDVLSIEHLKKCYATLSQENRSVVFKQIFELFEQFIRAVGLKEPYYLALDNSVLKAIKKSADNEVEKTRYVALLSFLCFLQKYSEYDVRIGISPAILFEYNGLRQFQNENDYKQSLFYLHESLTSLRIPIYQVGFDSYEKIRHQIDCIIDDTRQIKDALGQIQKQDWTVQLREGNKIFFPHYYAIQKLPKIQLKYFSQRYIELLLIALIENKILANKNNDDYARHKLNNSKISQIPSIIKIKKGNLLGIGDIDMLQFCDVGSQFIRKADDTLIGLTFDETLAKVLKQYSSFLLQGQQIVIGKDDLQSATDKVNDFMAEYLRAEELNKAGEKCWGRFVAFMEYIESFLIGN